jgi:hypothetical protein
LDEQQTDARLLRPVVDPTIPAASRELLFALAETASGTGLSGTALLRPGLLPLEPERRLATVNGASTGLAAGMLVVVTGAAPWAVGVLVFQGAVGWQSATGRYALFLMEMIVAVTAVVFGTQVMRFGQARTRRAATAAARRYRGRYLADADLDAPARVLLRRAQEAIDVVTDAKVSREGLLDEAPALAAQEWHIAVSLRDQAWLRARRAEITDASPAAPASQATAQLLRQHLDVAITAEESVTDRVAALERFASEVRAADAAYQDTSTRARLAELTAPHLDMLARTAADARGIAELAEMTDRARAIRTAFDDTGFDDTAFNDTAFNDTAFNDTAIEEPELGEAFGGDDPDGGD